MLSGRARGAPRCPQVARGLEGGSWWLSVTRGSDALPGSRNGTRPTRGRHQSSVNTCGFLTCVAVSGVQKTQKRERPAHLPTHTCPYTPAHSLLFSKCHARGQRLSRLCVSAYARLGQSSPGRSLWGDRWEPPMPPGRPRQAPLWEAGPRLHFVSHGGSEFTPTLC